MIASNDSKDSTCTGVISLGNRNETRISLASISIAGPTRNITDEYDVICIDAPKEKPPVILEATPRNRAERRALAKRNRRNAKKTR